MLRIEHLVAVRRHTGANMVVGTLLVVRSFPPLEDLCGTLLQHLKRQPASTAYQGVTHFHLKQNIISVAH